MSPPPFSDRIRALAALSGTELTEIPDDQMNLATLQVHLTDAAVRAGSSWAQIGATLGIGPKLAKSNQKRLAARAQRNLLILRNAQGIA